MDLRRFTQNGCISALKCRAEVLKSAFLWVWKFCVPFGVLWGLWEHRFAGIAERSLRGHSEGRFSVARSAGARR